MDTMIISIQVVIILLLIALSIFFAILSSRERSEKRKAQGTISTLEKKLDGLEKIVPNHVFNTLGLKDDQVPEIGMYNQIDTVIMDVNISDFEDFSESLNHEDVLSTVNDSFAIVLPAIKDNGGVFETFKQTGVSAIFGREYERSLTAAVSISDTFRQKQGRLKGTTISIHDGSLLVGAVGYDNRMDILALSGDSKLTEFLSSIGNKYNAGIIVTAKILDKIPNSAKKFQFRWLGYLSITSSASLEKIYDVFDGDDADTKNQKRKTKMVFEKGVVLFTGGETLHARQHFIEALKTFPGDRAAKEYLLLCDNILNKNLPGTHYLEKH